MELFISVSLRSLEQSILTTKIPGIDSIRLHQMLNVSVVPFYNNI